MFFDDYLVKKLDYLLMFLCKSLKEYYGICFNFFLLTKRFAFYFLLGLLILILVLVTLLIKYKCKQILRIFSNYDEKIIQTT